MAYHEAGHAVCSYFLPEREKLILITIDPSSEAFGMIRTEPRPHHNETRVSLSSTISSFIAGHLAEEMFAGVVTTGCIHDLAAAQNIAADMVLKFGMGKELGRSALQNRDGLMISEFHKGMICRDIQQIIREAEENARRVLTEHKEDTMNLAKLLLDRKTLLENELSLFFAKRAATYTNARRKND